MLGWGSRGWLRGNAGSVDGVMIGSGGERVSARRRRHSGVEGSGHRVGLTPTMSWAVLRLAGVSLTTEQKETTQPHPRGQHMLPLMSAHVLVQLHASRVLSGDRVPCETAVATLLRALLTFKKLDHTMLLVKTDRRRTLVLRLVRHLYASL